MYFTLKGQKEYVFVCFLSILIATKAQDPDPCTEGQHRVNSEDWRNIHEEIPDEGSKCDRFIIEDWYRFDQLSGDEMPTNSPGLGKCSTDFPIWMNGDLPGDDDGVVTRQVCQVAFDADCRNTWDIEVKKCSEFYVYYLPPAPGCPIAYCIGTKLKCPAGQTSETGFEPGCVVEGSYPVMESEPLLDWEIIVNDNKIAEIMFKCTAPSVRDVNNAENHPTIEFKFDVTLGDVLVRPADDYQQETSVQISEKDLLETVEDSDVLSSVMGNDLTCKISVRYENYDQIGDIRESSIFLGFKVETKAVTVRKRDNIGQPYPPSSISIEAQVPILCQLPGSPDCELLLEVQIPPESENGGKKCLNGNTLEDIVFGLQTDGIPCAYHLSAQNWSQPYTLDIYASETTIYDINNEVKTRIRLGTSSFVTFHQLWGKYTLPEISVLVINDDVDFRNYGNAKCSARNDPHMTTFDGKDYEMHLEGEFMLYRHKNLPIQVHGYFGPGLSSRYSEVCGFAVQSGSDLYVYDQCRDNQPKRVKVYGCDDYAMNIIPRGGTIEVVLVTGTRITFVPRSSISISVSPSDWDNTEGLCGTFNGNCEDDMVLADGSYSTSDKARDCTKRSCCFQIYHNDFAESWKISNLNDAGSLYSGQLDNMQSWRDRSIYYCACAETDTGPKSVCGYTQAAEEAGRCVDVERESSDPAAAACIKRKKRQTDVLDDVEFTEPTEFPYTGFQQDPEAYQWKDGWSEQKAQEFCTAYMTRGSLANYCVSEIRINPDQDISKCMMDILMTGNTSFSTVHKASMQGGCGQEISKNLSVWQMDAMTGDIKPPEEIKLVCPADCSDRGNCSEGVCVCEPEYTGPDCSFLVDTTPELFDLPSNGLCDIRTRTCRQTPVFADVFIESENLTCQLQTFTVLRSGNGDVRDASSGTPTYYHDQKILCPLPESTPAWVDEQVARGYIVSVANDGQSFSNTKQLVVFDGVCVNCSAEHICMIEEGYCLIDGICRSLEEKDSDGCYVCRFSKEFVQTMVEADGCSSGSSKCLRSLTSIFLAASFALLMVFL